MKLTGSQDQSLNSEEKQLILLFCIAVSLIFYVTWQYRAEKMSVLVDADEVTLHQVQGKLKLVDKHEMSTDRITEARIPQLTPFYFEPVPINSADQSLLVTLPGVGPAMADRIIEYRDQHGQITNIEQLKHIPGIGEKRSALLADHISFK